VIGTHDDWEREGIREPSGWHTVTVEFETEDGTDIMRLDMNVSLDDDVLEEQALKAYTERWGLEALSARIDYIA
jgi:hypothetical protein